MISATRFRGTAQGVLETNGPFAWDRTNHVLEEQTGESDAGPTTAGFSSQSVHAV